MTRHEKRQLLRAIADSAIRKTLGNSVPRQLRRRAARIYANAAYQHPWRLQKSKYSKFTPHTGIVEWVVKQAATIQEAHEHPEQP